MKNIYKTNKNCYNFQLEISAHEKPIFFREILDDLEGVCPNYPPHQNNLTIRVNPALRSYSKVFILI